MADEFPAQRSQTGTSRTAHPHAHAGDRATRPRPAVADVEDGSRSASEKGAAMAGRAYNAGLDEANLSKEQLALAVKRQVPNFYIHFSEIGSDPDKRNYIVSNQRLREAGFEASRSIDTGISELVKGFSTMPRGIFKNC